MKRGEIPLRERAHKYLKGRPKTWVNGGEMEKLAMTAGYKGSTISRELRRLAEESHEGVLDLGGFILRKEQTGQHVRSVWYSWVESLTPEMEKYMNIQYAADLVRKEFP